MAKALVGYLAGADLQVARLVADNAALRGRVSELSAELSELQEALNAANAVADGRLVDLVEDNGTTDLAPRCARSPRARTPDRPNPAPRDAVDRRGPAGARPGCRRRLGWRSSPPGRRTPLPQEPPACT